MTKHELKRKAAALLSLSRTVGPPVPDDPRCPHCGGGAALTEPTGEQLATLAGWDVTEVALATAALCRGHFNFFAGAAARLLWCGQCQRLVTAGRFEREWFYILQEGKTLAKDAPPGLLRNLRDLDLLGAALHELTA